MGKSMERTNVHQDVTPETLTGGLGVTMDTITAILSCVKTPDLLTTLRILGHDVHRKRFNTHDNSKPSGFVREKTFYHARHCGTHNVSTHKKRGQLPWLSEQNVGHTGMSEAQQRAASRLPYQEPGNKFRKNHSPTLSFMRFQPRTGRMKERRQAESQKMAAGVKS